MLAGALTRTPLVNNKRGGRSLQFLKGELVKSCLLTPVRPLISNYSGQDILLLDQEKRFLNLTIGETIPLFSYWPKPKLCTLFWA